MTRKERGSPLGRKPQCLSQPTSASRQGKHICPTTDALEPVPTPMETRLTTQPHREQLRSASSRRCLRGALNCLRSPSPPQMTWQSDKPHFVNPWMLSDEESQQILCRHGLASLSSGIGWDPSARGSSEEATSHLAHQSTGPPECQGPKLHCVHCAGGP